MGDLGSIEQWWIDNAGVPPHVARAIARSAGVESGGDPTILNRQGSGAIGTHQWLGPRKAALQRLPNWQDPFVQQGFALSEVTGGDPQATRAWGAIKGAKTEQEAYRLWRDNFGRGEDSAGYRAAHGGDAMQPEGQYGGALHINVQPHDPVADALLSGIISQAPKQETQEKPQGEPLDFLNSILARATAPQQQQQAAPQQQQQPKPVEIAPPPQNLLAETPPLAPMEAPPVPPMPGAPSLPPAVTEGTTLHPSWYDRVEGAVPGADRGMVKPAPTTGDTFMQVEPFGGSQGAPPSRAFGIEGREAGGAGLLNRLLGIGSAQAGEMPRQPAQQPPAAPPAAPPPEQQAPAILDRILQTITQQTPTLPAPSQQDQVSPEAGEVIGRGFDAALGLGMGLPSAASEIGRIGTERDEFIAAQRAKGKTLQQASATYVAQHDPFENPVAGVAGVDAGGAGPRAPGRRGGVPVERDVAEAPPPPNAPGPVLNYPPGVKGIAQRLDDDLYRMWKNNSADMVVAMQKTAELPKEWLNAKFAERDYNEAESRLIDPRAKISDDVREVDETMEPMATEGRNIARELLASDKDMGTVMPDLLETSEGWVHRKRVGGHPPGERLDPGIQQDIITGGGGRSLGRQASALHPRTKWFMGQDQAGQRQWSPKKLGEGVRQVPRGYTRLYGDGSGQWHTTTDAVRKANPGAPIRYIDMPATIIGKFRERAAGAYSIPKDSSFGSHPLGPEKYGDRYVMGDRLMTARPPTSLEIEANTPVRYIKNRIANTIDNWLRLRRVKRNVDLLNEWKPRLQAEGLLVPEGAGEIPGGFVRVEIPQLRGFAHPRIANVLNDFYRTSPDGFEGFMGRANRFLIGTMFALPIRHQLNVATHYTIGRGFDWVKHNPQLIRANRAVNEMNHDYVRLLRAGAGLQYADTMNQNFYKVMLEKLFNDQMNDPAWSQWAHAFGIDKVSDLVKAEYAWSQRSLWRLNDVFLVARIMELEGRGIPTARAIQMAEKEIPNYRIPESVAGSRNLSNLLQSKGWIAFGRYDYGKWRALAETVKDMVGPGRSGEERLHAVGQAVVMALLGTVGYKIANYGLQSALSAMSNYLPEGSKEAIMGSRAMKFAFGGPLGLMEGLTDLGGYLLGLDEGEKTFAQIMPSIIMPAPAGQMLMEVLGGMKSTFTGEPIIDPRSSTLGKAVQTGEFLASPIYPLQLGLDALRKGVIPGLGPPFALQQEYEPPSGKVEKMLRGRARSRERKDPVEGLIERLVQ